MCNVYKCLARLSINQHERYMKKKTTGKAPEYEAENMKITNLEEANQYFHYKYLDGWNL